MARKGVNRVTLIGNLGADPAVHYTQSGSAITTLSVATSESWTDKGTGEKKERTEWHRVKLFGKLAELAGEYLAKGRQVYIEGSLSTSKYTGKDGVERYSTEVVAREMQMLGGRPEAAPAGQGAHQPQSQTYAQTTQRAQPAQQRQPPAQPVGEPVYEGAGGGFTDDDIPFAAYQKHQLF